MSDIVLTAAVRQNLLSLQDTADLLSTTQTRLATGKKVNSALDNPTNFFTAAGLDARASDIGNLLDSIGNGVQVLQAADTGITSLQKLVDTAKSIANQALQQPSGYSTKSSIQFTGTGVPSGPGHGNFRRPHDQQAQRRRFHVHKSAGTAVTITVGTAPSAFNPVTKTAQVQSLDQFNQALAVAGVNLSALITGPDSLTFTSTNDGAGQVITGTAAAGRSRRARRDQYQRQRRRWRRRRRSRRSGCRPGVANRACYSGQPVQPDHPAAHHHGAGRVLQRHQPAGRQLAEADLRRNRQIDPDDRGRDLQSGRSRPGFARRRHRLHRQRPDRQGSDGAQHRQHHVAVAGSAFGANLSIVQIRQDFSKKLINVLQTGSSNLTLADSNEEAANSQALSTRQSIAVSALALANQSQQSVLQLLR